MGEARKQLGLALRRRQRDRYDGNIGLAHEGARQRGAWRKEDVDRQRRQFGDQGVAAVDVALGIADFEDDSAALDIAEFRQAPGETEEWRLSSTAGEASPTKPTRWHARFLLSLRAERPGGCRAAEQS